MNKNIFKGVLIIFHRFQAASWLPMIKVCSLCLGISHANTLKCICAEENLLCLFAANAANVWSQQQHPLSKDKSPLSGTQFATVSTGVRPHLTFYPNFTRWLHSTNKLVSFATHLAGEFSNNIFIPFENMNHSHAEYKITSLPLPIKGTAR